MTEAQVSEKDLWRTAKKFMGWKSNGSPTQLLVDNKLITSSKDIAKLLNDFFVEKIERLRLSCDSYCAITESTKLL